jgi:spermidine synthase
MLLKDAFRSVFRYTDAFHLALAYRPEAKRVLFLGLGGGSAPKQFRKFYPKVAVDVVEIDPEVLSIATKLFALTPDLGVRTSIADGRQFIRSGGLYDAICLDAYFASSIPFHLTTQEFFRLVKSKLVPGGVVIANIVGAVSGRNSKLVRSEYRTLGSAFPKVWVYPVPESNEDSARYFPTRYRNVMLVATTDGKRPEPETLKQRVDGLVAASHRRISALPLIVAAELKSPMRTDDVPLLTDDYAPVDDLIPVY